MTYHCPVGLVPLDKNAPPPKGAIYDGDWHKDQRHGTGKFWNNEGVLIHEGEFRYGKPQNGLLPLDGSGREVEGGVGGCSIA